MSWIKLRISTLMLGLPPRRLDFQSKLGTNRSKVRKANLFGDLRRSTLICCRRNRISASSRTFERNKLDSAVHSSMRTSTIGHEHHPTRPPTTARALDGKTPWDR